jgi:hypothetical protein
MTKTKTKMKTRKLKAVTVVGEEVEEAEEQKKKARLEWACVSYPSDPKGRFPRPLAIASAGKRRVS